MIYNWLLISDRISDGFLDNIQPAISFFKQAVLVQ